MARVKQKWQVKESGESVTADGNARGTGKLIGVIFDDYKLSEPFEIGSTLEGFEAPQSGLLYVRCQEKWNSISDNVSQIKSYVRKAPKK